MFVNSNNDERKDQSAMLFPRLVAIADRSFSKPPPPCEPIVFDSENASVCVLFCVGRAKEMFSLASMWHQDLSRSLYQDQAGPGAAVA